MMKKSPKRILIYCKNITYSKNLGTVIEVISHNQNEIFCLEELPKTIPPIYQYLLIELDFADDPFNLVEFLTRGHPTTKIIILSFWSNSYFINKSFESGAIGFYQIGSNVEILLKIIDNTTA